MRDKKTSSIQFSLAVLANLACLMGVCIVLESQFPITTTTNKNGQESQRNGRFESAQQRFPEASRPSTRTIAKAKIDDKNATNAYKSRQTLINPYRPVADID
jgi:hypothetical protein